MTTAIEMQVVNTADTKPSLNTYIRLGNYKKIRQHQIPEDFNDLVTYWMIALSLALAYLNEDTESVKSRTQRIKITNLLSKLVYGYINQNKDSGILSSRQLLKRIKLMNVLTQAIKKITLAENTTVDPSLLERLKTLLNLATTYVADKNQQLQALLDLNSTECVQKKLNELLHAFLLDNDVEYHRVFTQHVMETLAANGI